MKTKRFIDPFTPNRPVDDPEKFAGREEQVDEIIDSLFQIANNNPKHTIITGDRGIGKSSLLLQTKLMGAGDNRLPDRLDLDKGLDGFDFVIAWHDADANQTPEDITIGLLRDLNNVSTNIFDTLKIELDIAGFIKVAKKEEKEKSISDLVDEFTKRIKNVHKNLQSKNKYGILLFIDELDRIKPDSGIATFFKLCAEKLVRDDMKNVAFMTAGITGAIQNLESEHGSIFRTFRDIPLPRLTITEIKKILISGFEITNHTYDNDVFKLAFDISGGYPEPVHLIGSEMLSVDEDGYIDVSDFNEAKIKLVKDVRRNKLHSILERAGYGKYQLILEAMAKHESQFVPLKHIANEIGQAQNQFSTNISNLVQRGVIIKVEKGVYSFLDPLLKEYIRNFGIIQISEEDNTV